MPKYEKKISLGYDNNGKLIRKSIYANTKPELEKKVFAARQAYLQNCSETPNNSITFMAYARRWFKLTKSHKSPFTIQTYKNIIEYHLAPRFEDLYFSEITLADIQNLITDTFDRPAICNQIKQTVMQIYDAAADDDLIQGKAPNFKRLVLPEKNKKPQRALTEKETDAIFSADLTDKEKALLFLLYYTGMRSEEVRALDPSCFDFKAKTVTVKQTLAPLGVVVQNKAKTKKSLRTIPLPDPCVPFLRQYVESCGGGFLFPTARDKKRVMYGNCFFYFFENIKKKLVPLAPEAASLHPHVFRHNYATLLYYSEVSPKKAADLLGHTDTKMINELYAHLDENKERTVEKLNAVFSR